ncbi:MAG: helix-turn-helix transcriptional regulator [Clostridia bacterium]|nr:helix-turn-helix transcriptional regulator [Clostridia bacterium]
MEMKLAENIRRLRKERSLTQEQLAEVLMVTAGAVYKWEAGLSVPDIALIVEMADFFDTSVDALLGYSMRDNHVDAIVKRMREYRRNKDREGLTEAEKALKRYPHSFQIVKESAAIYRAFGIESRDKAMLHRALELLEQSRLLLDQNTDPEINEQTICAKIAETYLGLDEVDKGVELMKQSNAGGLFSSKIGNTLAQLDRAEEATPYLSEAMAKLTADLCNIVSGYMNVFGQQRDYASAEAILSWGVDVLSGLRKDGKPNFFDKVCSAFLAAKAQVQFESGNASAACESLIRARDLAAFFDAAPSYDESDIRFMSRIEGASVHDDIGATAMDAIQSVVDDYEKEAFTALWNSIKEEGIKQ